MAINYVYRNPFIALSAMLCLFILPRGSFADTLYLKNGRTLEGIIKDKNAQRIELDVGFGIVAFEKNSIDYMEISTPQELSALKQKWDVSKQRAQFMRSRAEEERNRAIAEWKLRHENELKEQEYSPKEVATVRESGHMMVDALLNKKITVSLLVDTGASLVILTRRTAQELGVDLDKNAADVELQLADGRKIHARYVVLENVSVQDAQAENVEAAVLPDDNANYGFWDGKNEIAG